MSWLQSAKLGLMPRACASHEQAAGDNQNDLIASIDIAIRRNCQAISVSEQPWNGAFAKHCPGPRPVSHLSYRNRHTIALEAVYHSPLRNVMRGRESHARVSTRSGSRSQW